MVSSLRFLLDTTICIYIAKRRPPEVLRRFEVLSPGEVGMSVVTYGELDYGVNKSRQHQEARARLDRLIELIPVLALNPAAGERYGAIRAVLEQAGTPIGNNGLWIAAHALSLNVCLVSNNISEFQRVSDLKLENWAN